MRNHSHSVEAGYQAFDGEIPASFVYSDNDYNNTRRYRMKQSAVKYVRLVYAVPSFNLKNFCVVGSR